LSLKKKNQTDDSGL